MLSQIMVPDSQYIGNKPVEFGECRSNPLPLLVGIAIGQIALLEEELGASLFFRTAQGMEPTGGGRFLFLCPNPDRPGPIAAFARPGGDPL